MINEQDVEEYKHDMLKWIVENTDKTYEEVKAMFDKEEERIEALFEPYPETIMHQDPSKWAELLAISFGFLEEIKLEFID